MRHIPGDHDEFVRLCGPAYVDPVFGYVITPAGRLLFDSYGPNTRYRKPSWQQFGLPSLVSFLRARLLDHGVVRLDRAVVLRHPWEWNYYHFWLDTLGKLELLDRSVGTDAWLVVGHYVDELPWAGHAIRHGDLSRRRWHVQDRRFIRANEVYFARTRQAPAERLHYLLDEMRILRGDAHSQLRVFLTRDQNKPRHILNIGPVLDVVEARGFRVVDTAGLALDDQIELFRQARYIIAIHGAGLTNLIFRRDRPLGLLELMPAHYQRSPFATICREFGFDRIELLCEPAYQAPPQQDNLTVDVDQLSTAIDQLIQPQITAIPRRG